MKRILLILISLGIVVLLGVLLFIYFRQQMPKDELWLYGNVDVRQVDIGFRVPGQVEALLFEEGDYVKAGSLMAHLSKTPYVSQMDQSQAQVEASQSTLKNAEILLKRRKELIGIGGISQEDLDVAESNVSTYRANLAAAEAALVVSKNNYSYTQAYAPADGVVLTRVKEPGSVLNAYEPVYVLSIASPVWVRAFVAEPNLGDIYYGMPAHIYTDTKDGPVYTGKIGFISPIAEFTPKTVETTQLRTDLVYRLRIYVDNPDHILKQGMPVTVKLNLEPKSE